MDPVEGKVKEDLRRLGPVIGSKEAVCDSVMA